VGRGEEVQALAQLPHEALVLRHPVQEVRADGEDDADGRGGVVGDARQARGEGQALGRVGHQRVELLELVHEEENFPLLAPVAL